MMFRAGSQCARQPRSRHRISLRAFPNPSLLSSTAPFISSSEGFQVIPPRFFFDMTTPADLRLGPLTTIFNAPGACNSITVSTDTAASTAAPYLYPRYFSSIANSCFPSLYPLGSSAIAATYGAYGYHDEHVYFSPGICPSGWNQNIAGSSGSGTTAETTAFCCMPGFGPQTTPAVDGAWGYYSTYCTMMLGSATVTTVPYTGDGVADGGTRTFTFSGNTIPAGAVWIRWKSADFAAATTTDAGTTTTSGNAGSTSTGAVSTATSVLTSLQTETVQVSIPPASSAPLSTATTVLVSVSTETVPDTSFAPSSSAASSTAPFTSSTRSSSSSSDSSSTFQSSTSLSGTQASPSTTSTTSPPTSTSPPSPNLSTGAKIGIGVSAGFAVLFALAILIFLLRRRKEKSYPNILGGPEVEAASGLRGGGGGAKELPAVTTGMRLMSELPARM
ncbi:hypothetical protein BDZ45DRAFT_676169 [Acephala macrosclerotiorum]|nr:hypothetical protein BDZ45DRAFT_676169 [Acephala macrosclerotiorum]